MFKVTVDPKSIESVQANVKRAFDKVIANQKLLNELGETIVKDIRGLNRTGKSPKTGQKHPSLTPYTIKERGKLAETNQTAETYKQEKSNVTFTGQLLDSIESSSNGPGSIIIKAEGDHKQLKGKIIQAIGEKKTNDEIITDLKSRGFYVMGIRDKLIPRLRKMVIAYIRRASNTLFKLEKEE